MKVRLIGLGCGTVATLTESGRAALKEAQLLIGAQRLLDELEQSETQKCIAAVRPQDIMNILVAEQPEHAAVVYSGDTGFYSGAKSLLPLLESRLRFFPAFPACSILRQSWAGPGRIGTSARPMGWPVTQSMRSCRERLHFS